MFCFLFYFFAHKQVVKQLLYQRVRRWTDINARNLKGHTALDIFERQPEEQQNIELSNLLKNASALRASDVRPVRSDRLPYVKRELTSETRNVILMVAILLVTATYQAGVSPPSGFWQDNYQPSKLHNNSTPTERSEPPHKAGKVVMNPFPYFMIMLFNGAAFHASILLIDVHLPRLRWTSLLSLSLFFLSSSYAFILIATSTKFFHKIVSVINYFLFVTFWQSHYFKRFEKPISEG